jgi:5-(aminomethyl)-3-furanmethanol phosphate kinase
MSDRWLEGMIRPDSASRIGQGPIVKLGGSLLTRACWPEEVTLLVASLTAPVIIVGGGPVVDGLRTIDTCREQPADVMHDLAIDAMQLTARIVAEALCLPTAVSIDSTTAGATVLDTRAWLARHAACARLPSGWQVTSDSIAATVAGVTGRDLLLVKSLPPPSPGQDLAALATAGWVDPHFPTVADRLAAIGWAAPR